METRIFSTLSTADGNSTARDLMEQSRVSYAIILAAVLAEWIVFAGLIIVIFKGKRQGKDLILGRSLLVSCVAYFM